MNWIDRFNNLWRRSENIDLSLRPFPNEHSARLKDPSGYKRFRRENDKFGSGIHAIWGVTKKEKVELQAIRFDASKFTVDQAKKWLKDHDHKWILFEPATGEKREDMNGGGIEGRRDITCRAYSIAPNSIDEKKRSVEAVIATENPVMVFDMRRWQPILEILVMSGARLADKIPFVDSHNISSTKSVIGSTVDMRIVNDELRGRNIYSSVSDADDVWTKTREGHITDNSIGYRVTGYKDIESGQTEMVNGRSYTAPVDITLRISYEWEPKENSAVPIGADVLAKNRNEPLSAHDDGANYLRSVMMNFEKWLNERGYKTGDLDKNQIEALRKVYDHEVAEWKAAEAEVKRKADEVEAKRKVDEAEAKRKAGGGDGQLDYQKIVDEAVRNAQKANSERIAGIRAAARDDAPAELVNRAIDIDMSVEQFNGELLKHIRDSRGSLSTPNLIVDGGQINGRMMEAAMLLRSGYSGDELVKDADYGDEVVGRADKLRHTSLVDICRQAIILDGMTIPAGREDQIERAFSTTTLPIALGNIAHKSLLKGYKLAPATWRKWCSIGNVSDFKDHTRLRFEAIGQFEEVGNGGEVPHGTADEEYERIKAKTYAKNFSITRQDIINDDQGVFTKYPQDLGMQAQMDLSRLVYVLLLANGTMQDGVAIFASGHSNLNTSAALSKANIAAAKVAFMQQTNLNGEPISIMPKFLLVPPELVETANEFWLSDYLLATGVGSSADRTPARNVHKGTLEPIPETRLSNSSYTGYSATSWYLMASPGDGAENVEVAFLNGVQNPVVRRFDPGHTHVGGVILQAYFDVGVAAMAYRTMQKNNA